MTVTEWKRWFAWRPVRTMMDDGGERKWLCLVERRRVTEAQRLSAFAAPGVESFWQYRTDQGD